MPAAATTPASFTAGQIAALLGEHMPAELVGNPDAAVHTLAGIEPGQHGALTFIRADKYARLWPASLCPVAIASRDVRVPDAADPARALILVPDADLAIVAILERVTPRPHLPRPGVHPSAVVEPSASIDPTAAVGPLCYVGPGAVLAEGVVLGPRVTVAAGARIGAHTVLHSGVVVQDRCSVGARCILHPNTVIGADGFGYHPKPDGSGYAKIPHAGTAVIEDDCELGACTCVDRGKFGATRVGRGTKLDNHVQIGHNADLAEHVIICGNTSVGGSAVIGTFAQIGGQAGVGDHVRVGANTRVGGASAVNRNVPDGETWFGNPVGPAREMLANFGALRELASFMRKFKQATTDDLPSDDQTERNAR